MPLHPTHPFPQVSSFDELVNRPYAGAMNAVCWNRQLEGNFEEIVQLVPANDNMSVVEESDLITMPLSEAGLLARDILLQDFQLLKAHGASPTLNVIRHYERDEALPFFATDVYSWHVDRSPVPTDTILCTYFGAPSDILPNAQAVLKIELPYIRAALNDLYGGAPEGFDEFLKEHFFDLHYAALPGASIVNLGVGNMWRLSVDHPGNQVLPCVHRAPLEQPGQPRLLMIC